MLLVQRIQVTLTNDVKLDPFKVYRYLVLSVYKVLYTDNKVQVQSTKSKKLKCHIILEIKGKERLPAENGHHPHHFRFISSPNIQRYLLFYYFII